MQAAVRILAGPGHEAAVVEAGRAWGLTQTGRTEEARAARAEAKAALRSLPVAAFPAVVHVTLTNPARNEAMKRLRLVWASVTGRI